jgi:hypothetical protein
MPSKIEGLVLAAKSLPDVPAWKGRGPDGLELMSPLEIENIVVEGLTMRARARKTLMDRELVFQL